MNIWDFRDINTVEELRKTLSHIKEYTNEVPEACFINKKLVLDAEKQSLFNISEVTNIFGMKVYTYKKW